jgi:hypothetical protein
MLDLSAEGLELGVECLHFLLLGSILSLLQVKKTKVLFLPRYRDLTCLSTYL